MSQLKDSSRSSLPRQFSPFDQLIAHADQALRTLVPGASTAQRPTPANQEHHADMTEDERRHAAGLMRINHTGEVCAQALYQGQALTAKQPEIQSQMQHAAEEEVDHLVWCEQRLKDLNSHTSRLNPLFYGMSFALGAVAGKISDRVSLGFVAATEEQVCKHLTEHLGKLPEQDQKSRAVIHTMLEDESRHADEAIKSGGRRFPAPITWAMSNIAKVMTKTTYRW